jgi:hypothetical protein
MASLKTKILLILMIIGLPLCGQSFIYTYVDPCTKQNKIIYTDATAPIVISYYGQVQTFTYTQLSNGEFDGWVNSIYNEYKLISPCQEIFITTITITSSNQISNIIGNIINILNLDVSSTNINNTISSETDNIKSKNSNVKKDKNNSINSKEKENNNKGNSSTSNSSSNNNNNNNNNNNPKTGDNSSNNSNNSDSKTEGNNTQKTEEQKTEPISIGNTISKAKTETQKPAIILTGDFVGVQTKSDKTKDARGTVSFTRVKGDGTNSLGLSMDYMVNSKIGNISFIRSWIDTTKKGNKNINVFSGGVGFLPQSTIGNILFVKVNSLKKFTTLYGVAGNYGMLYKEETISTIVIGGFMYKGKVTKTLDATVIMAGIYSPYSKLYTESVFKSKPVVIPFLSLNYKLTKTFGFKLTAGGVYISNQDVLNYQVLLGAKLKI